MFPNRNIKRVCAHICHLGEGPVWDVDRQKLYWTDILRHIDIVPPPRAGRNGRLISDSAQNRKYLYAKGNNYMP